MTKPAVARQAGRESLLEIEEFLMSMNNITPNRSSGFALSPIMVIRICSVLFVGLMLGHVSGYPWSSPYVAQETELAAAMKSVNFVFAGEAQTYWNLYLGWGVLVAALLLTIAITLWLVSDLALVAPRRVAAITGVISALSLIGCYISFRFFYIPPAIFFAMQCLGLLWATVQLLKAN
jgi:hypothetical protein